MTNVADNAVVLAGAVRLPTGKFLGSLSGLSAPELGAMVIREAIRRAEIDPALIDEVIMGNVVSAGVGQAPARQAALKGGVPDSVPALTINKVCGSSLKAVMLAANSIIAGENRVVVAGGMESMSNAPYILPKARTGYRMGDATLVDSVVKDGLWCAFEDHHMGVAAEIVAEAYAIPRAAMDEFAYNSHQKAVKAIESGQFTAEVLPVEIVNKKNTVTFNEDEPVRADTDLKALAGLRPVFKSEGSVTAGNAPGLSDGASAILVTDMATARKMGIPALARVTGYASAAREPRMLFAAPPLAVRKLLDRTGTTLADYDLFEVNEAFASQVLANAKELDLDLTKVNVNGGAIALGHPIGASGAKILTTLMYALQARGGKRGMAVLCLGGGGAVALAIEML